MVKPQRLGFGNGGSLFREMRGNAQKKGCSLHGRQGVPSNALANNADYTALKYDDYDDDDEEDEFCSIEDYMRFRDGAEEKVTNRMKGLFALTYVAYIAIYFARKPMSVVKPVLAQEGFSQHSLAMVDTSMLACYALGQFMIGHFAQHLTMRQMLCSAFLLCGVSTMGLSMSNSAGAFSVLAGAGGFFAACVNPLLVIFISDTFPVSMRATVVGLWQTSQQAGGILANNVAALVLAWRGWRHVFLMCGLVVMAFAAPLGLILPAKDISQEEKKVENTQTGQQQQQQQQQGGMQQQKAERPVTFSEVVRLPGVLSLCTSYMLIKMARYCLMFWLPTYFVSRIGMPAAKAGAMASFFDAGGVLGGVAAGLLTDKLVKGRMMLTTLPYSVLGCLSCLAWSFCVGRGDLVNVVCMVVVGFLVAGPDGILGGAASKNLCEYLNKPPSYAPAISGLVNGVASLGVIAMSACTSNLLDRFGWAGLFMALGVMMGGAAVLSLPAVVVERKYFRVKAAQCS
uniref:Major facilitator superfamily (MFS) profile domain-containing protein n=1 Tax=Octactis speculum TaxID=3111310 RepID=A0A7S2GIU0_9STRA|eukprot:CAMPEP_0185764536 /NCGR_PEP_ID=MMETSP1174-20130828/23489_1 /TAXON_ID=35687 /ORGANISM="Dictyocha speculum, Strain CCMP1381" /LENGTH=511 /DNA_ID=CAMNT_0028447111 /DNA_START=142 /DNA_END=1677 /DNA_ORIENTATION=-